MPAVLAGLLLGLLVGGRPDAASGSRAIDDPMEQQKSIVLDVCGEYAVRGTKVHPASLRYMLNTGVRQLSGQDDPALAWQSFVRTDEVVALVFTANPGHGLATEAALAGALLDCLFQAGFEAENLLLVGLDERPPQAQGTRPFHYGWQTDPVDLSLARDYLPAWLADVTAIINVPSIMDDNVTGLRCGLYNLSLGLVKQPGRFYLNGGDPFIPVIYDCPEIRSKVRLHIANALRILYYGGPIIDQSHVYEHSSLLFSTDPVALDTVALHLVQRGRRQHPLPAGAPTNVSASYLETAYQMGIGHHSLNFIDYRKLRPEKF